MGLGSNPKASYHARASSSFAWIRSTRMLTIVGGGRVPVRQRETLHEAIKQFLPAREGLDIVGCVELLGRGQTPVSRGHSSTLFPASSRA